MEGEGVLTWKLELWEKTNIRFFICIEVNLTFVYERIVNIIDKFTMKSIPKHGFVLPTWFSMYLIDCEIMKKLWNFSVIFMFLFYT